MNFAPTFRFLGTCLNLGGLVISLLAQSPALGAEISLPYSGRLVEENSKPVTGPVDLVVEFFATESGGESTSGPHSFPGVALQDGVFQINLALSTGELHQIFKSVETTAWIQVTDVTNGSIYPRQQLAATPYALKVPVDGTTVTFDDEGRLSILPNKDGSTLTGVKASSVGGKTSAEVAGAVTQVANSTTSGGNDALVKTNGSGEVTSKGLILPDGDSNTLTLKANSNLTSTHTYTFPPAPIDGNYLTTDAGGNLSWGSLGGGGDMAKATYDTNLDNVIDRAGFTGGQAPAATAVDMGANFGIGADPLVVDDTTGYPTKGYLLIDDEVIAYGGTTATSFTTLTRGAFGTTDALHLDNAKVTFISYADVAGGIPKVALGDGGVLLNQGGRIEFTDNDANKASIVAPADLTSDVTYTLPPAPVAGKVLSTDGSGTLSWTDAGALAASSVSGGAAGTIADNSITADDIGPNGVSASELASTTVSAGSYTAADITVDEDGRLTAAASGTIDLTSEVSGTLPVANGGTGGTTAATARSALSAAASGSNSDITALTNLDANSISGNTIDGGTISDFASTGIDDNAAATALTIDATGQVGIGSATPGQSLDVAGNIALSGNIIDSATGDTIDIRDNDIKFDGKHILSEYGVWIRSSGVTRSTGIDGTATSLGLFTNTTERVRVNSLGNVGIGTTAPDYKLEIGATSGLALQLHRQADLNGSALGSTIDFSFNDTNSGGAEESKAQVEGIGLNTDTSDGGELRFYTADSSGTMQRRMNVTSSGLVTIESVDGNKANLLNYKAGSVLNAYQGVWGGGYPFFGANARLTGDTNTEFENTAANAAVGMAVISPMRTHSAIDVGGVFVSPGNASAGVDIEFSAMNPALTWNTSGDVGIGTTNPSHKLHIGGVAGTDGIKFPDDTVQLTAAPVNPGTFGGRLTLTSGVPVTTTNVTAAGTLYLTPYKGNAIAVYTGTQWIQLSYTELSLALSVTSGNNYDVFVYNNAGTLALELSAAWANNTTRTDALTTLDGVYAKAADNTRRFIGTIRASGLNQTEDSNTKRFVWNLNNQKSRRLYQNDPTDHNYFTATWRQYRASAANQVEFVRGIGDDMVSLAFSVALASVSSATCAGVAVGVDNMTAPTGGQIVGSDDNEIGGIGSQSSGTYLDNPAVGYHYISLLHRGCGSTTNWHDATLLGYVKG